MQCLFVLRVARKHGLVQARGPRVTVIFLTLAVLAQGGGGTHYISFLLVVRAMAPFVSQAKRPPWQGVWAAATINTVGMRSLERRRPLSHANPLGYRAPAYLLKGGALHERVASSHPRGACGAVCGASQHLQRRMNAFKLHDVHSMPCVARLRCAILVCTQS